MAYRVFADPTSFTEDLDTAVALDLDEFSRFAATLERSGWRQDKNREERWYGRSGTRVDIVPAGARLRSEGKVVWPKGEMAMSLVGFDHVFSDAVDVSVTNQLTVKVVPLPVLVLLKIIAYGEDRHRREKDLQHIAKLLADYESDGERRFAPEVIDAGCTFQTAGAYLLGVDVGTLCTASESALVDAFLHQLEPDGPGYAAIHRTRQLAEEVFHRDLDDQINAFALGFARARHD